MSLPVVGAIYNLVRTARDVNHTELELNLSVLWLLAAVAVLALGVIYAVKGTLQERRARELGLRVRVTRVNKVDPMRIGVASPAPVHRKLATKYQPRIPGDAELDKAIAGALAPGANQWFVMVAGRSTVGKSRTLFEALCRYDARPNQLELVAPRNAAALQKLFDPTEGVPKSGGPAVLWLDDIEDFLNAGMTVDELHRWRSGADRRMVAATFGGGAVTLGADVLQYFGESIRRITLDQTSADELQPLLGQLAPEEFDAACKHGLAAYLVAGPLLADKLEFHKHPRETDECHEGLAVVEAAIDWARCGRSDPVSREALLELWRNYLPSGPYGEDRFKTGLDWALKPVAGRIALLYYDTDENDKEIEGYRPYPYAVRLRAENDAIGPRPEAWVAAAQSAPPPQAMSVGCTAFRLSRWGDAVAALTRAATAPADALPPDVITAAWALLYDAHSKLGQREEAIDACEAIISRVGSDPDPGRRSASGNALLNKGNELMTGWPDREEKLRDAVDTWDLLINGYFRDRDTALRLPAATAILNKVELLAGPDYSAYNGDEKEAAIAAWDLLISDYYANPEPNPDPILRQRVATALLRKAHVLGRPGPLGAEDDDDERQSLAAYKQLIDTFRADPDPNVQDKVRSAVLNMAIVLTGKGDRSDATFAIVQAALQVTEQTLASLDIQSPGVISPERDEATARCLLNKGAMLSFLGGDLVQVRGCYERIIKNYSGSNEVAMRRLVATATMNDGSICAKVDHLVDDARVRYERVIADCSSDDDPVLRRLAEKATSALEELKKK